MILLNHTIRKSTIKNIVRWRNMVFKEGDVESKRKPCVAHYGFESCPDCNQLRKTPITREVDWHSGTAMVSDCCLVRYSGEWSGGAGRYREKLTSLCEMGKNCCRGQKIYRKSYTRWDTKIDQPLLESSQSLSIPSTG